MGFYDKENPGRAGEDVSQFDGWAIANIINYFLTNRDMTTEYGRTQFRRAMLISKEYNMVSNGVRFNV